MAITHARLVGAFVKNLPAATAGPLIKYVLFLLFGTGGANDSIRSRALTTNFTHASILSLNAVLVEAPELLLENFPAETPSVICRGLAHSDVS